MIFDSKSRGILLSKHGVITHLSLLGKTPKTPFLTTKSF